MFIKIGEYIFNTDNIAAIRKEAHHISIDFNCGAGSNDWAGILGQAFNDKSPDYPQALAAYDWFCKAAISFDDIPSAPDTAPTGKQAAGDYAVVRSRWHDGRIEYGIVSTINNNVVRKTESEHYANYVVNSWNNRATAMSEGVYIDHLLSELETANELRTVPPQPATVGTGNGEPVYTVAASDYGVIKEVRAANGDNLYSTSNGELADEIAELLNTETSALRAELAVAREQVAVLTRELSEKGREVDTMQDSIDDLNQMVDEARKERDAIKSLYDGKHDRLTQSWNENKSLQYVINHAFKELRTYDGDSGAIIAARMMLEPYTTPDTD